MMELPGDPVIDAWARLMRISQHLLGLVERDLKQAGFPALAWYDALLELKRAKGGQLRPFELQGAMLLPQYNISRLLERLVRAGYVRRVACDSDGRGQFVEISDEGRELLRRMWPVYADAIQRHVGRRLNAREAGALHKLLGRLV
jgi:DNA-binding MarR family transcriptional regulator